MLVAVDWTGSCRQRVRDRGTCEAAEIVPNKTPRFLIPAGVKVLIRKVQLGGGKWYSFTTTRDTGLERYEFWKKGVMTFRHAGYEIQIQSNQVIFRQD